MTPEDTFWLDAAGATPDKAVRLAEAAGATIDPDEANWRPLTGNPTRDLPMITQEHMNRVAHWLWEQNPLANRIIELPIAYLLSEGVKLTVPDDEMQKVLSDFWTDPINDMDIKLPKKVRELALFGEQCYPTYVNEVDGKVRISYLDPVLIDHIATDPDNREQPIGVVTKLDKKGRRYHFRVIINGPESVFTQATQALRAKYTDGDCFYFRVNDLAGGTRGRSDLLHQADWLDIYDQFLFGESERYSLLRSLVWDLTVKNANKAAVDARAKEFNLPKSGGVYVHNDSEVLEPKVPDLKAQDTTLGARLLRNHMLGGASIPEHWFGGGGDVNRATAAEMGDPAFKVLAMRQRVWKHILESIARYVMRQAKRADGAEIDFSDPDFVPVAIFPELVSADLSKLGAAFSQVVVGCAAALMNGFLSKKTCIEMIGSIAGRFGLEIDPQAELEQAVKDLADAKAADVYSTGAGAAEPAPGGGGGGAPAGTGDAGGGVE